MAQDNRPWYFLGAVVAAVILALIGIFYLTGHVITSQDHPKRAILAFVLAVGALVVANFNRPSPAR